MNPEQRLDYLYKEYVRLSQQAEEYIKSAFEDLKLMGVIGATISLWKPIVDAIVLVNPRIDSSVLLFLGFLSLLLIVAILGFWNMIKQSYVVFFVDNLQGYEEEIRKELNILENPKVFSLNLEKKTKHFDSYKITFRAFLSVFAMTTIFIPFFILLSLKIIYSLIYLLLSLAIFGTYYGVLRKSTRKYISR